MRNSVKVHVDWWNEMPRHVKPFWLFSLSDWIKGGCVHSVFYKRFGGAGSPVLQFYRFSLLIAFPLEKKNDTCFSKKVLQMIRGQFHKPVYQKNITLQILLLVGNPFLWRKYCLYKEFFWVLTSFMKLYLTACLTSSVFLRAGLSDFGLLSYVCILCWRLFCRSGSGNFFIESIRV